MKEYLKLLILITVMTTFAIIVVDLLLQDTTNIYTAAVKGVANGIVLSFVIKKV